MFAKCWNWVAVDDGSAGNGPNDMSYGDCLRVLPSNGEANEESGALKRHGKPNKGHQQTLR